MLTLEQLLELLLANIPPINISYSQSYFRYSVMTFQNIYLHWLLLFLAIRWVIERFLTVYLLSKVQPRFGCVDSSNWRKIGHSWWHNCCKLWNNSQWWFVFNFGSIWWKLYLSWDTNWYVILDQALIICWFWVRYIFAGCAIHQRNVSTNEN